mmetsp:Transcript_5206/g.13489  ORF Transcript_5206/g.13489 Transcript_5206/m.13489 type:complete len:633 (+) Transcript_5206:52-1950(+)
MRQRGQPGSIEARTRYPLGPAGSNLGPWIIPRNEPPPPNHREVRGSRRSLGDVAGVAASGLLRPKSEGLPSPTGWKPRDPARWKRRFVPSDGLLIFGAVLVLLGAILGLVTVLSSTVGTSNGRDGHSAERSGLKVREVYIPSSSTAGDPPSPPLTGAQAAAAAWRLRTAPSANTPTAGRRERVRQMMETAWGGYKRHAWGANELRPVSKQGHSAQIFGSVEGATIVDALDTLILMNMTDEVAASREWIETSLNFDIDAHVSTFEVCIRYLGGLLSAFALTGDELYKRKAAEIGDRLLPAFDTPTGIPWSAVNLRSGDGMAWAWAPGGCAILSELGTMSMEFNYLSRITANPIYAEKVQRLTELITSKVPATGLYPNWIDPQSGDWGPYDVSVGALGDSFYEYLYKGWILAGKPPNSPLKKAYDNAITALRPLIRKSQLGNMYIAESKNGTHMSKMGHLACFIGGLFAMSAADATSTEEAEALLLSGRGITETCYRGYANSPTGLGPEEMLFDTATELSSSNSGHRYYILRPEVIESYFYMWRITRDERYRTWAWEAVQALETHARCGTGGYCGIKDVQINPPVHDDLQQSFFLAETLKYLYLIFSNDDILPLDRWVLNTEAHPLPVLSETHR